MHLWALSALWRMPMHGRQAIPYAAFVRAAHGRPYINTSAWVLEEGGYA